MMEYIENIKNIIAADRQDSAGILLRLEKACEREDIKPDLRVIYVEAISDHRRRLNYFDYLLECCERWPSNPPIVSSPEMTRVLGLIDGLCDFEELINEITDMPAGLSAYFIKCSCRWRLDNDGVVDA
jgi:hypothetical protein